MSSLPDPPAGFRWWRPEDAPALEAAWADATITQWNPVPTGLDAAAWISGVVPRWEKRLSLDLVIDRDGAVAGEVGLSSFSPDHSRVEIGFWVAAGFRGAGVARSALIAVTTWSHDVLEIPLVWARTSVENAPAMATMRSAGFEPGGSAETQSGVVQGWVHRS